VTVAVVLLDRSVHHVKLENVRLMQEHDTLREAAFRAHPDMGGSVVRFQRATAAYRAFVLRVRQQRVARLCRGCGGPLSDDLRRRYCSPACQEVVASTYVHRWERTA
jgi:hypothetical protein